MGSLFSSPSDAAGGTITPPFVDPRSESWPRMPPAARRLLTGAPSTSCSGCSAEAACAGSATAAGCSPAPPASVGADHSLASGCAGTAGNSAPGAGVGTVPKESPLGSRSAAPGCCQEPLEAAGSADQSAITGIGPVVLGPNWPGWGQYLEPAAARAGHFGRP